MLFRSCLRDAIAAFAEETQDAEVSLPWFRDWLTEWGRASRQRQTGVLLLTAHRAKGLEFDHVIVLDGEWRRQNGEDADESDGHFCGRKTDTRFHSRCRRFDNAVQLTGRWL